MPITQQDRESLLGDLTDKIDDAVAVSVASHLPPDGWGSFATKADLAQLSDNIDLRIDACRYELRGDIKALRSDVTHIQSDVTDLKGDVKDLRTDMKDLRTEFTSKIDALSGEIHRSTYALGGFIVAVGIALKAFG